MIDVKTLILVPLVTVPLAIVSYIIYYASIVYRVDKKYKNVPGPEPKGLLGFFLGNVPKIIQEDAKGVTVPEVFFNEMVNHNTKTLKLRFFKRICIVTCDPRVVKEVLIEQNAGKDPESYQLMSYPGGMRFLGNGLVTDTIHERWLHKRALFNPGFHKKVLMSFIKEFNRKGDILMEHLKNETEKNGDKPISLLEKLNHTALDVIASVAFSMDTNSINDKSNNLYKCVYDVLDGIKEFFNDPFIKINPTKRSFIKQFDQNLKSIRSIGREEIEKRIRAIKNGEDLPDDILTVIFKSHENEEFSVEDMVDEFATFFLAGQETTANVLASAFLELGRNPDVLEKLRDEIDSVLGSKSEVDYEDLNKLRYTGYVFKEALRLYPPVHSFGRITTKDICFDDLFIPKQTYLVVSPFCSGRTEELFTDSTKFDPDRFSGKDLIQNYSYFPFSMGARNCIGQNFAQIEAKLLIAKFIQNFDFKLDPTQSFRLGLVITLRPKDGTKCFLSPRKLKN